MEALLTLLWRGAFSVLCDRDNNPAESLDKGQVVAEVYRTALPEPLSRANRSSCAATVSPASPSVTQKIPSGKWTPTFRSCARATARTVFPMPPWP